MATVPNPRTWGAIEAATAAKFNIDVRDAWEFFLNDKPLCHLRRSISGQTIAADVGNAIVWDTEVVDTDAGHSTVSNQSRYTAQTAGLYSFNAIISWSYLPPQPVWTQLYFVKNGAGNTGQTNFVHHADDYILEQNVCAHIPLVVNDYVELYASPHGQSGTTNIYLSQITIEWIST